MAALIRTDYDLPTLRVQIAPGETAEIFAMFDVFLRPEQTMTVATVPTRALGLSDRIRSAEDVSESRFALAGDVVERISSALHNLATDVPAYWLELPAPRGYLQLVPWERLLSPALGVPLLRLPNIALRPTAPGPTLHVAVAAGLAVGMPPFDVAGLISAVARTWTRSVDRVVLMDVFVDAGSFPSVRDRTADLPWITVHDTAAMPTAVSDADRDEEAGHPWVRWLSSALAGTATDVVHVLSHGHISGDRGALTLPASPSAEGGDRRARFIGPALLCDALAGLGAWSLLISAVPDNHCEPGLRDLADAVSQARAGAVVLHRMSEPDPVAELGPAIEMVYAGQPQFRPLSGITCWSHPSFVAAPADVKLCDTDGTSALITGATQEVLSHRDTPTWVAAGTRVLETLQAEWIPADGSVPDPHAVAALQTVSKLFDDHVRAHALPDTQNQPQTDVGGIS